VANAGLALAALLALDATAFAAPAGWVRAQVDAAHASIAPGLRTIERWVPAKPAPEEARTALFYAVGDGGIALDAYVARVKIALPAGTTFADDRALALCNGQPGRFLAFALGDVDVEETIASADVIAAAARYERAKGTPEDPGARKAIETLCPQGETSPDSD